MPPAPTGGGGGPTKAASFQDRINHLESLVVQLLNQDDNNNSSSGGSTANTKPAPQLCAKCAGPLQDDSPRAALAQPTTPASSTTSPPAPPRLPSHAPDVGKLQIDSARSAYVSSPHWSAVLSGLSELKSFWPTAGAEDEDGGEEKDDFFPGDQSDNQYYKGEPDDYESPLQNIPAAPMGKRRFQLLFGGYRQQSLEEILQVMPPRAVVDRLVLLYFNNMMLPRTLTLSYNQSAELSLT